MSNFTENYENHWVVKRYRFLFKSLQLDDPINPATCEVILSTLVFI